jgi:hypothetical protein
MNSTDAIALFFICVIAVFGLGFLATRGITEPPKAPSRAKFLPDGLPESTGVPRWLISLGGLIFEKLPMTERQLWTQQFINLLPSNLPEGGYQKLKYAFLVFWVERQHAQMNKVKYPKSEAAVMQVLSLLRRENAGENVSQSEWLAAKKTVDSAHDGCRGSAAYAAEEAAMAAAYNAASSSLDDMNMYNCRVTAAASKSAKEAFAWEATWRPSAGYVSYGAAAEKLKRRAQAVRPIAEAEAVIQRDWLIKALQEIKLLISPGTMTATDP